MLIQGKFVLAALLANGIPSVADAQIPVTDAAAIEKGWAEHVAQLAEWGKQLESMQQQYVQMQRQYASLTGPRGMSNLLNSMPRQGLPDGFTQNYEALLSSGRAGASDAARVIYDAINGSECTNYTDEHVAASCEARAFAQPENAAYIEQAIHASQQRAEQLQQLIGQVDTATDMKAATDLANRISAEPALLNNEQTLVDLALAQRQSQTQLIAQQNTEGAKRRLVENTYNPLADIWD